MLTNRDFHLQTGNLDYKTGLSFTNGESWVTNGILSLLFTLYVTERCVFQLLDGKMTVIEIAPGIDLQKDIIDQMDFVPAVSPDLKLMDAAMFEETWGGIHM